MHFTIHSLSSFNWQCFSSRDIKLWCVLWSIEDVIHPGECTRKDEKDGTPVEELRSLEFHLLRPLTPEGTLGPSAAPKTPEDTAVLESKGLELGNFFTIHVLRPHPRHALPQTCQIRVSRVTQEPIFLRASLVAASLFTLQGPGPDYPGFCFWNMSFNVHRTLYTLTNTPGPAHSRLVAGTADVAQKWPEVVSPRPVETEVPEVPTAALLPLLFSC